MLFPLIVGKLLSLYNQVYDVQKSIVLNISSTLGFAYVFLGSKMSNITTTDGSLQRG